jgi:predicted nucleotidyltransferase
VRPNERHPLYPEVRALLLKAFGPQHVIGDLLSNEDEVQEAYLFGSWADRYHGKWGTEWGDIDVAAIGSLLPSRIEELEVEAEDLIGWPVHIVVVEPASWNDDTDAFIRTVKRRPLVPVEVVKR